jgi:hypothetical protein
LNVKERRKEDRIPLDQRCWCEGEEITLYSRVLNGSRSGAFIRTATPLRPGDVARLVWNSPDGEVVVARAEVVWTRERGGHEQSGMGLRLVSFERGADAWEELLQVTDKGRTS